MYTIKEICNGALMIMQSVLGKKREYGLQFNKEKDGCWYVDFPHWPFSHDNLAMVSGADKLLELLSDGDFFAEVSVIPTKNKGQHDGYIELEQTEYSLFGGSTYQVGFEWIRLPHICEVWLPEDCMFGWIQIIAIDCLYLSIWQLERMKTPRNCILHAIKQTALED